MIYTWVIRESISGLQIGMTWSLPPEIADTATQKVSIIIFSIKVARSLDREQFNKQVDVGKPWENHGKTWRFKLGDPVQSPFFESITLGMNIRNTGGVRDEITYLGS